MKLRPSSRAGWALPCLFALTLAPLAPAATAYHFLKEIPVGGDGGWDYLTADAASHRLYVSHATKVIVVDTATDLVVGEIADTPGVHGIALAPALNRGFVSNGRQDTASIVDLKTLQTLARVATAANPDCILFEPGRGEVYTFNGHGQSFTVFEASTGKVVATVPVGGKPEFAQADPAAGRVYANIEDTSEVIAIDTTSHQIVARWPIAPGEEATGMAIDLVHHRLVLGCGNARMIILDSTTGKVVANLPAGHGIDATSFDPGTQLAFASAGDGTVTIVHEDTPDTFTPAQTLTTERSARTMTLDPITHKIYLASAQFEKPAETEPGARRTRPKMIPGTFKILVYGLK